MISIDQCIGFLASYGASKQSVSKVLDIPLETFLDMCKEMPDVEWKPSGQTIGDFRALRKRKLNAKKRLEKLENGKEITLDLEVTLFGHTGTLREIADKFSPVSNRSVLHRLKLGFGLEEAILKTTNRGPTRAVARSDLQNQIHRLLFEFKEQTGVDVSSVEIEQYNVGTVAGNENHITGVRVILELFQ